MVTGFPPMWVRVSLTIFLCSSFWSTICRLVLFMFIFMSSGVHLHVFVISCLSVRGLAMNMAVREFPSPLTYMVLLNSGSSSALFSAVKGCLFVYLWLLEDDGVGCDDDGDDSLCVLV